ncbi:hypothetical protein [Streptomyces sp. NPDC005322]|uniref:hypothetical protein n=1 Tax=Streptomyces sp. NPDC005322 TaxID=3157032 RepID=UPI0033B81C61
MSTGTPDRRRGAAFGTTFRETMVGRVRLDGEDGVRPIRLDLRAEADGLPRLRGTTRARVAGRIRVAGWADDPRATGESEISPLAGRRIRYRVSFAAGRRRQTLDDWKSLTPRRLEVPHSTPAGGPSLHAGRSPR